VRPSGYCWVHDPQLAEQQQEWRREGGKARSNARRARAHLPTEAPTTNELVSRLGAVFRDVIDGRTEPKVGTAAATIAKTLSDIRTAGEVERLAAELDEIKALLARRPA